VQQLQSERQGITPQSKAMTPDQQRTYRNLKRALNVWSGRSPF